MTTLADLIDRNAGFAPQKAALNFERETLSYAALAQRIEAVAAGLAGEFGVRRGDRIVHLGYNSADMLVLLLAAARIGAMLVPLNWRLAPPEHAFIVADAEPALVVVEAEFLDRLGGLTAAAPAARAMLLDAAVAGSEGDTHVSLPELATAFKSRSAGGGALSDPLLIVYTSGTTGRPKGAVLTQDQVRWNALASIHMHGLMAADHVLTVLPMFHVGGLNIQTTPALLAGASVTIHRRFMPDATLAAIASERPSLTVLVPPTLQALLDQPGFAAADLSSLRLITTGSTIVPEHLIEAFAARGVRIVQVYGSTETGPVAIYERFDQPRGRPGTTGVAGIFHEAMIGDDAGRLVADGVRGEILIKGPNLFSGYWRDQRGTAAAFRDGWYLTGDIASRGADGHFSVHDRKKNVIISGGENIYPAEIERVIAEFPGVAEAAVVGRPDPRWQEVAVAVVVASPGAHIDTAALMNHLAANLARYKLPREVLVRDALPKNALGKILHYAIRRELGG
jgi:fatty-acyl-CoA synthase